MNVGPPKGEAGRDKGWYDRIGARRLSLVSKGVGGSSGILSTGESRYGKTGFVIEVDASYVHSYGWVCLPGIGLPHGSVFTNRLEKL